MFFGLSLLAALWTLSSNAQIPPDAKSTPVPAQMGWTDDEIAILRMQWIGSLPPLLPDPTNAVADNPKAAVLGQKIFFDSRFSANGKIACSNCHQPEKNFTDGRALSKGMLETPRSAPSIVGIAYSPWFFWDGRSDSMWSQALGPLESGREHGGNRTQYARIIYDNADYKAEYEAIFGVMSNLSDRTRFPDDVEVSYTRKNPIEMMTSDNKKAITRIFVNIGKAIAAYERLIIPGSSRFDRYVEALLANDRVTMEKSLSSDEVSGLRLFIGKAMCVTCHQGPLFTHNGFHNIGIPDVLVQKRANPIKRLMDQGRYKGVQQALKNEFNCLSEYSDAKKEDCTELHFAKTVRDETLGAFKVPTLRNIAKTAPYMHSGQFADLAAVLKHYNNKVLKAPLGHSDLLPTNLSDHELDQLENFLRSLSGPMAVSSNLLQPPN